MPELPEVETTKNALLPHLVGKRIEGVVIRQPQLRWPVSAEVTHCLPNAEILGLQRRAKYLIVTTSSGEVLIHLGMSGSLRIVHFEDPPRKHDHVDVVLADHYVLRYHDPRRFGCMLWAGAQAASHPLLQHLGPEPLSAAFNGKYLYAMSRKRHAAVKALIMDQKVVVGVGNIYACESLFLAKIHPLLPASALTLAACQALVGAIKKILRRAIKQGGTTLRDYLQPDGQPGYFAQTLAVYGRTGEACTTCGNAIGQQTVGGRSTFFCVVCQCV